MSDSESLRFKRLRLGVLTLGVLVILAFTVSSAYDTWRAYHRSIVATDREIGNLANALAEQTAWTFRTVDLLLLDTARWYSSDRGQIPPEQLDRVLANRTAGMEQVSLITIVDAHGIQRHRSRGASPPNLDVSDRSYFIAQRDGTAQGLFMSEPLITRSENRAAIVLSHRLDEENGAFAGVVTAIVNLDAIKQFYRAVNLGAGSAIQLVRDDGTLLARNPPAFEAVGVKFPELAASQTSSAARLVNPIDGRSDFIAVAPIRDTPLKLTVTRDAAVALHAWRDETIRVALRTIVFVVLGTLTLAALLRQIRRVAAGQRALRESEERYALAMEGADEGHWDWNVTADRLFLSPRMKTLYGLDADSVIDSRSDWLAKIVIHPDDMPHFETALRDHFSGRTPSYECEYRVRQQSGEWHWLRGRGRCLRDAAGDPIRFVGSSTDVTGQRQAQTDKEQLEWQLRQSQKMEAIGTMAGGIAHDFNNILGAILGYGELAQQKCAEGSPLRRYLDNVMHAAERAKIMVGGILGFSRSGLGERAPVNIRSVVTEALELLDASLPADIRLERRIDAGDAAVIGDATYLHQVVMNLCTNAIQAMEHGGGLVEVVLECVEINESRALLRGSLVSGPYVRLIVSDTGAGIPPAVLERMFDPFFTTKTVGAGTGLGLSLVHGIVADMGGAIGVTTEANRGTRFEIWLPLAGEISTPVAEEVCMLPRGNGETVMIVDDERALVGLAEEVIAGLGYEPVGFASSSAALHAFQAAPQQFDVVLTDESMPDLSGTELAREIRRIRPTVAIIVMSGYGGSQLANRAAEIGVNAVLRKPLQNRDLAESLARVFRPVN